MNKPNQTAIISPGTDGDTINLECVVKQTLVGFPVGKPMGVNEYILDTESYLDNLAIFGYYEIGGGAITQIFFPEPVDPTVAKEMTMIKKVLSAPLHIYYCEHEGEMFGLDVRFRKNMGTMHELMPYKYCQKEKYIRIEPLTQNPSRRLPDWGDDAYGDWGFHNLSCLIKEIVLYMIKDPVTLCHNFEHHYRNFLSKNREELVFNRRPSNHEGEQYRREKEQYRREKE